MMNKKQAPDLYAPFVTYDNPACFDKMSDIEWRGQLQSSTGGKLFRIKYYHSLFNWEVKQTVLHQEHHKKHYGQHFNGLIAGSDSAPELIYAIDIRTNEEILLFDGCLHGYNNLFCDEWSQEQRQRTADKIYQDSTGNEVFEILVTTWFNIDYTDELDTLSNEEGQIELLSGEITTLDWLQKNGFDAIAIHGYDNNGTMVAIYNAELA